MAKTSALMDIGQVWMPPAAPGMTLRPEELGKPVRPAVSAWNPRLLEHWHGWWSGYGGAESQNIGDLFKCKAPIYLMHINMM